MTVYKPTKSRLWQYDFQYKSQRYHGSTGQANRRAAEAVERKIRQDAAEGRLGDGAQLTLDEACGRYWLEHAKDRGDAVDTERRIKRLLTLIPKNTRLADITTAIVSTAVQRRRGQTFKKSKKEDAKEYAVTNGTVNRDVIDTLRPILRRARIHWGAKGLPEIAWGDLKLTVPRESVRIYSPAEQVTWRDQCGPTAELALRLLLTYGMRFGELFFHPSAYQGEGPRLAWTKGRKGDVPHTVPLLPTDAADVAARVSRALAAGLETIWYIETVDPKGRVDLEALSYTALQSRLRTAAKRAGIEPGRVIHGARHHAGTRIMRASGDMKVVQRLLGHIDPKSTHRYVHTLEADVRAALEGEQSRNSPEPRKRRKRQPKAG